MQWPPFQYQGKTYDVAHLHSKTVSYVQPAEGKNPSREYRVDMIFSLDCFTSGGENETPDPHLLCDDDREVRIF